MTSLGRQPILPRRTPAAFRGGLHIIDVTLNGKDIGRLPSVGAPVCYKYLIFVHTRERDQVSKQVFVLAPEANAELGVPNGVQGVLYVYISV